MHSRSIDERSLLRHLAEIGRGRCSIRDEDLAAEPSEDKRKILAALLTLHQDLELERERWRTAETNADRIVAELRESIAWRDDFLAVASHELRTPLATLNLQVRALAGALDPPSPRAEDAVLCKRVAVLARQIARLERLVGELLDVTKIRLGKLTLRREPVDMLVVVRDVAERYADEIARSGASVTIDAENAESGVVGQWDASCVDQIVTNLLTNALRYGEGSPIRISVRHGNDIASLVVENGGIGIAPTQKARLFAQFGRAVSSPHAGGLGLGLWIVRKIVNAHGGRIDLVSELGAGATFTVQMPIEPPATHPSIA
jgi:signal transduction histidine kinase